jgi:hypothetical protein
MSGKAANVIKEMANNTALPFFALPQAAATAGPSAGGGGGGRGAGQPRKQLLVMDEVDGMSCESRGG